MQLHDPLQVFLIRAISAAAAVAVVSKWWDETEAQRSASPCFFNYFIYYGISTRATDKKKSSTPAALQSWDKHTEEPLAVLQESRRV